MIHLFFLFGFVYLWREIDLLYYNIFQRKKDNINEQSKKFMDDYWQDPIGSIANMLKPDLSGKGILKKSIISWILCGIFFTDEKVFIYLLISNLIFNFILYIESFIKGWNIMMNGAELNDEQELKGAKSYNIASRSIKVILLLLIMYNHFFHLI